MTNPVIKLIIYFHYDECPYCQDFKPVWKKVIFDKKIIGLAKKRNIKFMDYNIYTSTKGRKVFDMLKLESVPAIMSISGNNIKQMTERSEENLKAFIFT